MPEILTEHPDVVLKVLASQGAKCGVGVPPKVLTKCPADRFCSLAGGELCVFGTDEMTQLAPGESGPAATRAPTAGALVPREQPVHDGQLYTISIPLGIVVLVVGFAGLRRRRKAD
ncbi:MAG: hypothetical protein HOV81_34605 [Kofleriaceae bacterium]|nr:hypothetical protein [Kofleriaceae bacterium]